MSSAYQIVVETFTGYRCPRCPAWSDDYETAVHHCDCDMPCDLSDEAKRTLREARELVETEAPVYFTPITGFRLPVTLESTQ